MLICLTSILDTLVKLSLLKSVNLAVLSFLKRLNYSHFFTDAVDGVINGDVYQVR